MDSSSDTESSKGVETPAPRGRPAKLRKPWSSGMRLAGIAAAFVVGTSLLRLIGSGPEPEVRLKSDAEQIVDTALAGEPRSVLFPPYDQITIDGTRLATAFGTDWKATMAGRQMLFSDPTSGIVCQALVLPMDELERGLEQFNGDFTQYAQELTLFGAKKAGELQNMAVDATIASSERISRLHDGNEGVRFVLRTVAGGLATRRVNRAVLARSTKSAATLQCANVPGPPARERDIDRLVRGFRIKDGTAK